MPHVELYIADQICDLQGDEKIEVDYTIFDITKIESRGGARSYSFDLPKTDRNKSVLENPEMVNNLSQVPYTRLKCRCYVDGVDTLIMFCEVASVKDSYAIRLYGSNSDLFASIKDLKLSELDMSEFDHYWTLPVIAAGMARTVTQGYVYPLIDYHLDSPNAYINNDNKIVRGDFLLPALYYNYVLQKIFDNTGYTWINTVESETATLIIPAFHQNQSNFYAPKKYEGTFGINNNMAIGYFGSAGTYYAFDTVTNYNGNYYQLPYNSAFSPFNRCLKFQDNIKFHFKMVFEIINPVSYGQQLLYTFFFKDNNGNTVYAANSVIINMLPGTNTYTLDFEFQTPTHNSELELIFFQGVGTTQMTMTNVSTVEISNVEVQELQLLTYGEYLSLPAILPDITQLELLKNYMQMFCLLPVIDEPNKIVTLVKFDDILLNVPNCYDWGNKLDLTEDAEITFIQDSYGQNNNFIYKQDGDEPKPIGTDGSIVINNSNLEKEKDVVELVFAGTNSVVRIEGANVDNIGIFENGEYKSEREPRVLVANIQTYPYTITLQDSGMTAYAVVTFSRPYFIDASQTFNLGFANNLLDTYYDLIADVLGRVKLVKVLVRLNVSDISQLDFTRPVFIQKYESYFYISSIKGFSYTESKSTLVELVKLNING
ncbi:hypothetical protein UFOVP1605_14 [uncultured Caudovirales phage]|uniref:Uncharacterized protein n=1 Tax=uncultured Caudovirales phage TaxID=2100421 RepID=A0A6J5SSE4_9CAUD|nr:hypothetical protein UFOVP1605_14 [uncultured Caudovirales phage]